MQMTTKKERLEEIKLVNVMFFRTECKKCHNIFVHEKMWQVPRLGINNCQIEWYYCQHCFPTKEEVLNEIDSEK